MSLRVVFEDQIGEIERDRALALFGACVALLHVLSFLHWVIVHPAAVITSTDVAPVCWPFFEDCHRVRWLGRGGTGVVLWVYGVVSCAGVALFLRKQSATRAYFWLVGLTLFNALILFQDYRLRLNQHYMALWITFVFLLVPDKRRVVRALIVGFYVWAGLLKLDGEWLSGEGLYGKLPLFVPQSLIVVACWYVVVLEIIIVFGVFARTRWIYWGTLAQLGVFHLTSWTVVNFFYPTLMFAILAIFPLTRLVPAPTQPTRRSWPMAAVVSSFSVFQLVPYAFPGDPALTGQGRMFALHMFDARVACTAVAVLRDPQGRARPMALSSRLPARIVCDPIVYFNFARAICRERAGRPDFDDLDLLLRSKRLSSDATVDVVNVPRFCSSDVTYDVFRANPWIRGL